MANRVDYTEMKRLRDAGVGNADIAARLGCSVGVVDAAARRFGWPRRRPGQHRNVDVPLMFRLWADKSIQKWEIAKRLGISESTLASLAKRHHLPQRLRPQVVLALDPTPDEIAQRARECRERHYAERRGETDRNTLQWRKGGAA